MGGCGGSSRTEEMKDERTPPFAGRCNLLLNVGNHNAFVCGFSTKNVLVIDSDISIIYLIMLPCYGYGYYVGLVGLKDCN